MISNNALLEALQAGRLITLPTTDKKKALRLLEEQIEAAPGFQPGAGFSEALARREEQSNTYLGYGIAMPHACVPEGDTLICAVGWSSEGIEYDHEDDWPVHLVLMYYVPAALQHDYLSEVSRLVRMMEKDPSKHDLVNFSDLAAVGLRLRRWLNINCSGSSAEATDSSRQRTFNTALHRLLLPDIIEMIEANRLKDLRVFLAAQPAPELAELLTVAREQDCVLIFRLLPRRMATEVFSLLEVFEQEMLLGHMAGDESRHILTALPPDDRTALFEELPAHVTQRLLGLLSDRDRKEALTLLSYPENSVGRLITNRFVTASPEWSCEHALQHIRSTGTDSETIAMVYIIDDQGRLVDDVALRTMILAQPSTPVSKLMDGRFVALHSLQDQEEAVKVFKKFDLYALPVVDADNVMLGIVTVDDILDISEEEATEDFHKGAAVRPLVRGYLNTNLMSLYRSRIPWLVTLVFVNLFSGAGIAHFETLIASSVTLVFFLPLLIDSGGNAGSQSATLVIRGLALGEVFPSDFARIFWREVFVALGLGFSMACAAFVLAWWRSGLTIGIVVALSMMVVVVITSVMGMALPFLLRRMKVDPATASAPLVTSLADILGVLIYFSIASSLLSAVAT
ncbi:MAG: magnesium transporter [Kiritimatiellae bacterium]|nr:magnesium transporter [Kiritimatiellia bacterium]